MQQKQKTSLAAWAVEQPGARVLVSFTPAQVRLLLRVLPWVLSRFAPQLEAQGLAADLQAVITSLQGGFIHMPGKHRPQ